MGVLHNNYVDYGKNLTISRYFTRSLMGCTALVVTSILSDVAAQVPPPITVAIDVIARDGDPESLLGGSFFLGDPGIGFFTPGPPQIDNSGKVFFYGYSDDGTGSPNNLTAGIWSGTGNAPTAIILDGMVLPQFTPLSSECDVTVPPCGEIFSTKPGFFVTPSGEITVGASRDNLSAVLSGNRSDNLAPLVTSDQTTGGSINLFRKFVNDNGTRVIGTLVGSDPFGTPTTGLTDYAATLLNAQAPGIPGVTILDISGSSSDDGVPLTGLNNQDDLIFTAFLSDSSGALYLSPSPGQGSNSFSLIAHDGDPAPAGVAGAEFRGIITGTGGSAYINDSGQGMFHALWTIGANPGPDNSNPLRDALWRFDASGNLALVISQYTLADPSSFYVTSAGARTAFLGKPRLGNSKISPDGDIYFFAHARQLDANAVLTGDEIFGLWKAPADGGMIELVLSQHINPPGNGPDISGSILSDGSELWSFSSTDFSFDADGSLIISLRTLTTGNIQPREGLFAADSTGTLQKIIAVGDVIEVAPAVNRTVKSFDFGTSSPVGGKSVSFRNDRIALNVVFTDNSNAVLRARFTGGTLEVTDFIWSGTCGDTNWHSGCADSNWNNKADSTPAEKSPGDAAGTENVTIANKDVVISDRAVHINKLNATGSLEVSNSLTLEGQSSIEDLALKADLTINAALSLTGTGNVWSDGIISGTGTVTVDNGAGLAISPANGSLDLKTRLELSGTATQTGGTLNLMGAGGKLDIVAGGTYQIESGSIVDFTDGVHIENSGIFEKTTDSTATVNAFFENKPGGFVTVDGGILKFTDPSNWAGLLEVNMGAVMIIEDTIATFGMSGQGLDAEGVGVLQLSGTELVIGSGTINSFNFTGDNGKVEVRDGTNISGDGQINNKGNFELINGKINADFGNEGIFMLVDNADLLVDDGLVTFTNNGTFKKIGIGTSTIGSTVEISTSLEFVNNDTIMVETGILAFKSSVFSFEDGGKVDVTNGAKLDINESTGGFSGETVFSGRGDVVFDSLVLFDSGTITNSMKTDGGIFDYRLDGGFKITGNSMFEVTSGTGIIDNFGDMSFTGGKITGAIVKNHANANLSIQGDSIDTRTLNATLVNDGKTFISAGLLLDDNGRIDNRNNFTIDGTAYIKSVNTRSNVELKNSGPGARLIKVGAGDAVIGSGVKLSNNGGNIEVRKGNLTVQGEALFNSGDGLSSSGAVSNINLSAGSKFILRDPLGSLSESMFFGTTNVTGTAGDGGQFIIDRDIMIYGDSGGELNIGSELKWLSGKIEGGRISVGGDTETDAGIFTISGSDPFLFLKSDIEINSNGLLRQNVDLEIGERTNIAIQGIYEINGHELVSNFSEPFDDRESFLTLWGGGILFAKADTTNLIDMALSVFGKGLIKAEADSTLRITKSASNLGARAFAGAQISGIALRLDKNATILLGDPDSGMPDAAIHFINDSYVELSAGSKLNNLPNVSGNLKLKGTSRDRIIFEEMLVQAYTEELYASEEGYRSWRQFLVESESAPSILRLDAMELNVSGDLILEVGGLVLVGSRVNIGGPNGLVIDNDSFISGIGTVNGETILSGFASPGFSPGTITINGDYTQTSTGVLAIEIGGFGAGTEYDQLIVNGTATFEAGSSIKVTLLDLDGDGQVFIPRGRSSFDIVVADDFILPTGADLDNLLSFTNAPNGLRFSFAPSGTGNGFQLLTIFGSTLLDLGSQLTSGQNRVAGALDGASTGTATDGLLDFALAIDDLATVAAKRDALEQASLSFASSLFAMSRVGSDAGHNQIGRHFDSLIWTVASEPLPVAQSSFAPNSLIAMSYGQNNHMMILNDVGDFMGFAKSLADNGSGSAALSSGDGMGVFVAGSYEFGSYDATRNQTGFDYDGAAATIGMDYSNAQQGWTVGIAGSASTLNGTIDLGRGTVDTTTYGISAYGLIRTDSNLSLDGAVSYGWVSNDYRRIVTIPGQGFTARGSKDGTYFTATGRVAYAIDIDGGRVGPFGEIRYSRVKLDRTQESGGGDASLIVGSGVEKFTTGQIGLRGEMAYKTGWGMVMPHLSAAWNYVLNQTAPILAARFLGGPDDSFLIPTDDYSRGGLALNAGLVIERDGSLSFSLEYQGLLFNKDYRTHSLTGHARWAF